MSAKVWLVAMVAGTALVVLVGARHDSPPPAPEPVVEPERPWLTPEAAREVIGADGGLGPLFTGVVLGGTPPLPAVRDRISAFAAANNVDIAFEIADDEVRAIRFAVTYSGCCGYEGADLLARWLSRPRIGGGCFGTEAEWLDDWAFTTAEGTHARVRVRVNRLLLRWEKALTFVELVERADHLLGADRETIRRTAGDRWVELEKGTRYRLEVPFAFRRYERIDSELGLVATVDHGRITEVRFDMRDDSLESEVAERLLRSRWGRPQLRDDKAMTWTKPDRIIRAELVMYDAVVALRLR